LAQAVHAAFEFAVDHPDTTREWRQTSNFLVVVAVPNEAELIDLCRIARTQGFEYTRVREPDYGNQLTAVALEPDPGVKKLCAQYPLALKEPVMT
jgi:peptidyl-tRNA hydrolase